MPEHQYTREEQYDMLAKLRKQVEFYFSPQNLAHDTFLRSLLEEHGENGVPVETLGTFPRVKSLYEAAPWLPTLLSWTMTKSLVVSVSEDGKWIRPISACSIKSASPIPVSACSVPGNKTRTPWDEEVLDSNESISTAPSSTFSQWSSVENTIYAIQVEEQTLNSNQSISTESSGEDSIHVIHGKERTTVICRDVPDGCDFEEVMEVFSTDSGRPIFAYRDFGNTWFIQFATEAEAVAGVSATQERKIRGQAIRAGIKSERTMVALPKREDFTAQPTLQPLTKSLKDLGIPIPPDETLRMPQRYKAPMQHLNVPQHGYYPMAPYSGYPQYHMNTFWPYSVPEVSGLRYMRHGYIQHVNNPQKKMLFLKKVDKGGYQNSHWKNAIRDPHTKRHVPGQATTQNVHQNAQTHDTESRLTSHGSFEKARHADSKTDKQQWQGSVPNSANALSQAQFPAMIDSMAMSRRTQSAPKMDYAAALLNSRNRNIPSGKSTSQMQHLERAVSKMTI